MSYEIRYTRLANSVRLTDRYLTVQVKNPSESEKSQMGSLFLLVEITNPWFPNSQIGQNIINTLSQEYYKQIDENSLTNFEQALKKVNQNLSKIAQNGETNWMGNLNAILMLSANDEIHLAKSGKGEAFLLRDSKIRKITEGTEREMEPNPLKTFTDIISGELGKRDKILITSPALLDYLSQKEIQDILTGNTPYENAETIAQFLKKEKVRHINLVITEALSKQDMENEQLDRREVVYLDQVSGFSVFVNSTKKYSSKIGPFLENISNSLTDFFSRSKHYFQKEISPRAKSSWEKTKEISQKSYQHFATKTAPKIKNKLSPLSDKLKENIKKQASAISSQFNQKPTPVSLAESKSPYSVHYYEGDKSKDKNSHLGKIKLFLGKTLRKIREGLKWITSKENRSVLYGIVVVILIIILVVNIGSLKKKQDIKNQEQTQSQALDATSAKYEDAKLAILYNDPQKAGSLLNEVINEAKNIMNSYPSLSDKAKEIITKANTEFDKLTQTTRFSNPKELAEFPEANKIFVEQDKLVTLNNKNNTVYYINKDGGTVSEQKLNIEGIFDSFGSDSKENVIYSATDQNQIYKISSASAPAEKLLLTKGTWEKSIDIAYFLNNIYLLDNSSGQIYKHANSDKGFGAATNYVDASKIDLKNAVSFSIDGQVYVLKSDNSIVKLSKDIPQDFSVHDIPLPTDKITKAKKIWTNSEINSLYILDDNRILELDKNGKFIHQYAFSPDINNIVDFVVAPSDKKIWILGDNKKAYQAEY